MYLYLSESGKQPILVHPVGFNRTDESKKKFGYENETEKNKARGECRPALEDINKGRSDIIRSVRRKCANDRRGTKERFLFQEAT